MVARALSLVGRHPVGAVATAAAVAVWSTIAVNAALLQEGPHPSPLIGRHGLGQMPDPLVPKPRPARQASEVAPASYEEDARRKALEEEYRLVREVQEALAERGFYTGTIDGLQGPLTEGAIEAYERLAGLDATGAPSPALLAHIRLSTIAAPLPEANSEERFASFVSPDAGADPGSDATSPSSMYLEAEDEEGSAEEAGIGSLLARTGSIAQEPQPDPQVEAVQRVLADLGYAPGRIDGQLGQATREAIRRFEIDRGMAETGEISDRLLDELSTVSGLGLG